MKRKSLGKLTRSLETLDRLLGHYDAAQLESLLAPEALIVVHASLEGEGASERLRGALKEGTTPGEVLVELTERHGADAVWRELPPRWRREGAGDEPPPVSPEASSPDLLIDTKQLNAPIAISTAAIVVPAIFVLHPAAPLIWGSVAVGVTAAHGFEGYRRFELPGAAGAIGANAAGLATALALRDAGWVVSRTSLFVCAIAGLAAGALVAVASMAMRRPRSDPPETF